MGFREHDEPTIEQQLETLRREIDDGATRLEVLHRDRLQCRAGCAGCCVDGLSVFTIEAARIRAAYPRLLDESEPHPEGACAFLDDDGACRIYEHRPYVCRTQGLPLRWLPVDASAAHELRDICPLNERTDEPLEALPADACWTLGPYEGRLAELERRFNGEPLRRIPLRDLWSSSADGEATAPKES